MKWKWNPWSFPGGQPAAPTILIVLSLLFPVVAHASATDVYISQPGGGSGASCASPKDVSFFNTSANWGAGAGQIGPGTTVHLCGTFTGAVNSTLLTPQGSGSAGNPITLQFEPGALLTSPVWSTNGAIDCSGKSYISIDGGTNGRIENTANGDALANHIYTSGINSSAGYCDNLTVRNLTLSNLYIKVQNQNTNFDDSIAIGFYGANSLITHNIVDHAATGIGAGNTSHHEISFNTLAYCQHCITDGSSSALVDDIKIHDNDIGGGAYLWDNANNNYHHNAVIIICESSLNPCITNMAIYNNYIHGVWSKDVNTHTTGAIFLDDYPTSNFKANVFNNLIAFDPGDTGTANGALVGSWGGTVFVNNTVVGGGGVTCMSAANVAGSIFKNNVLVGCGYPASLKGTAPNVASIDYNTYYQTYQTPPGSFYLQDQGGFDTYAQWQALGYDAHSQISSDPMLTSDGHLQSGSAAKAAGANLTSLGISALDSDKSGVARPVSGAWDAGAYQAGGTAGGPAANVYIAQSAAGSANGSSCANAKAVSYFNNAANWGAGAGQIGPGTTVHLCGTITSTLQFSGSGSSGNPITILAESGAKLSQPAGVLVFLNGQGYLVFDGGANGIMENTLNGTVGGNCPGGPCQFQEDIQAINASSSGSPHDIEIKNWTIRNLYVHSSASDAVATNVSENAFIAVNLGGLFSFHDNIVHDGSWLLRFDSFNGTATLNIYNNYFYNNDHDVAIGGTPGQTFTAYIHDNHSGSKANWDAADHYHHDGIHITPFAHGCLGLYVYNNLWDGDWGNATTAFVYMEVQLPNVYVFNNVGLWQNSSNLTNGMLNLGMTGGIVSNNVLLGDPSASNSSCLTVTGNALNIQNNAISGCNQFLSINGAGSTLATIDHNIYGNHGAGGGSGWYWQTSGPSSFSAWQSACACDAHSAFNAGASWIGLDSTGHPQAGSPAIGAGANLTSLSIAALDVDKAGVARPASGDWDVGAYQSDGSLPPDTQVPSVPTGLSATAVSASQINLTWTASTDNVGVTGYTVRRNGGVVATSPTNSYSDTGLAASTLYSYTVDAFDAAGNISAQSSAASATTQAGAPPGCQSSNVTWQNAAFALQASPFTATYDDTPGQAAMDGITALSLNAGSAYADMAVITRFNPSGTIDAINGSGYAAVTVVPYTAGGSYHVRVAVNPAAHSYSAFVTPPGSSEVQIANNYAFRTEQAGTSSLDNWALYSDVGTHSVCNFALGGSSVNPPCDVNQDGATNVLDVQQVVNQALGVVTPCTADINKDGACNVIDVQRVVNAALGGQCVSP